MCFCIIDLNGLNECGKYFTSPGTARLAALWTCCWYASQTQCWVRVGARGTLFMVDFLMTSLQVSSHPLENHWKSKTGWAFTLVRFKGSRKPSDFEIRPIPWVACKGVHRSERGHYLLFTPSSSHWASSKLRENRIKIMTFLSVFPTRISICYVNIFPSQHSIMTKTIWTLTQWPGLRSCIYCLQTQRPKYYYLRHT